MDKVQGTRALQKPREMMLMVALATEGGGHVSLVKRSGSYWDL